MAVKDIRELHSYGVGEGSVGDAIRDRLSRLVNQRVTIRGTLMHGMTGYQKTLVVLQVQQVEPLTAAGRRALAAPRVPVKLKDVPAYDVVVNAGPRLALEARDSASGFPLTPPDPYVPHWMTGGYVVYYNCREGYSLDLQSITPPAGAVLLGEDLGYGVNFAPNPPVVLKFRCTKKQ
jgi:hypothetical protein